MEPVAQNTIQGPMTTANSAASGRLKVDAAGMRRSKRKALKKIVKQYK